VVTEGGGVKKIYLFCLIALLCRMAPGQGVGGNGVPGAGSVVTIPATPNVLKGTGTAGVATPATPGTDFTLTGAVTPTQFGAYGDAIRVYGGCSTTASNTTVTCSGTSFNASTDPGKTIWIPGAAAGGTSEETTIVSVTDSLHVVVGTAPAGSVSAAQAIYGHDDSTALQSCFNYSSANQVPCVLNSPTGYLVSTGLQITTRLQLVGNSHTQGTNIFCETAGDCVSLAPGPDTGVNISNIELWGDQTQSAGRGIHLNPAIGQGVSFGGLYNANFNNVQVENFAQECLWMDGGGGSGYTYNLPNQYITLNQFNCNGPIQSHPANLIKMTGQEAQIIFINGAVNGVVDTYSSLTQLQLWLSYYPNPLIAIEQKTSGLNDAPMDVKFYAYTYEVGSAGLYVSQATNIHFENGYIEDVGLPLNVINSASVTFNGNHIANSGFDTGVMEFGGNDEVSVHDNNLGSSGGFFTAATWATCSNNNMIDFLNNVSAVNTTSGCATVQQSISSSTLTVYGVTDFINASGTSVSTIVAPNVDPGKTLTLYAGGTFTLAAGGNINFGGLPTPLIIPAGQSVTLRLLDLGPTWLVISTTAGLGTLASANTFTQPQTAPAFWPQSGTAGGPYVGYFDDFITGANNASNNIGSPTGASCSVSNTYADVNHPGQILLTTGTGGSGTGITCGTQSEFPSMVTPNSSSANWIWETAVYVPVLPATTAASFQAGLTNGPNVNPWTTGIQFYLSSANTNANHWYCRYSSTSTDSGVSASAATWTRLTMSNDGTYVHWFINGTEATGCKTAVGSMPSSNQYPASWAATALSSTSVTMAVDYVDFQRAVSR
jgi:hypothetical protein